MFAHIGGVVKLVCVHMYAGIMTICNVCLFVHFVGSIFVCILDCVRVLRLLRFPASSFD